MHPFSYMAPATIDEAIALLAEHGDRARCIAGGTDILVQARSGRYDLEAIVDVKKIPELMALEVDARGLNIGAAVPCCRIYEDQDIRAGYPGLIDAAELIGGIQIQSRASLGGNLCNSAPSADGIPPLIVHSAVAHISGPKGNRQVPVEQFCSGPGQNVLDRGEILVSLYIPNPTRGFGASYERFIPRNEMDIAVAAVGSSVVLANGTIQSARIALASVAPTPVFAVEAAKSLIGKAATDTNIQAASSLAAAAASPINDMRGTISQRKHLIGVLTQRTLNKGISRAQGAS